MGARICFIEIDSTGKCHSSIAPLGRVRPLLLDRIWSGCHRMLLPPVPLSLLLPDTTSLILLPIASASRLKPDEPAMRGETRQSMLLLRTWPHLTRQGIDQGNRWNVISTLPLCQASRLPLRPWARCREGPREWCLQATASHLPVVVLGAVPVDSMLASFVERADSVLCAVSWSA